MAADGDANVVARVAEVVDRLDEPRRSAAIQLMSALAGVLESDDRSAPGEEFRF
jgi:hypothetical protein